MPSVFSRNPADPFGRTLWMIALVFLSLSAALWYVLGGERSSANATRTLPLAPGAAQVAVRDAARAEGWRVVEEGSGASGDRLRVYARGRERYLLRPTDSLMVLIAPSAARPGQSEVFFGVNSSRAPAEPLRDRLLARLRVE